MPCIRSPERLSHQPKIRDYQVLVARSLLSAVSLTYPRSLKVLVCLVPMSGGQYFLPWGSESGDTGLPGLRHERPWGSHHEWLWGQLRESRELRSLSGQLETALCLFRSTQGHNQQGNPE